MNLTIDSPQTQLDDPVTNSVQLFLNDLRSRIGIEQRERDLSVQSAVGASQPQPGFVPSTDGVLSQRIDSFHPLDPVGNISIQPRGTGSIPEHRARRDAQDL